MGIGTKITPSVATMKKRPTMPAAKPKTGSALLKLPAGVATIPAIRPTAMRNLTLPPGYNKGSII